MIRQRARHQTEAMGDAGKGLDETAASRHEWLVYATHLARLLERGIKRLAPSNASLEVPWTRAFQVRYRAIDGLGYNGTHQSGSPYSSKGDRYFSIRRTRYGTRGSSILGYCLFFRSHGLTHQTCSPSPTVFETSPVPIFTLEATRAAGIEHAFTNFAPLLVPASYDDDDAVLFGYGGAGVGPNGGILKFEARFPNRTLADAVSYPVLPPLHWQHRPKRGCGGGKDKARGGRARAQ